MLSSELSNVFSITDDSGFLALINPEKYDSFVAIEWTIEQLQNRFTEQENEHNIFVWPTGNEGHYKVAFVNQPSNRQPFKEFKGIIRVTNESLYLANYEDLTMAAQFPDEKLPSKHNADLKIKLPNGYYDVLLHQFVDSKNIIESNDYADFEIVLIKHIN